MVLSSIVIEKIIFTITFDIHTYIIHIYIYIYILLFLTTLNDANITILDFLNYFHQKHKLYLTKNGQGFVKTDSCLHFLYINYIFSN